jgi:hypothetical protein
LRSPSSAASRRHTKTLRRSLPRRWLLFRNLFFCLRGELVRGFLFFLQFVLFLLLEHPFRVGFFDDFINLFLCEFVMRRFIDFFTVDRVRHLNGNVAKVHWIVRFPSFWRI